MTEMSVLQLVLQQAIPSIVSVRITTVYNMAETYFVSQPGTGTAGAVGTVLTLIVRVAFLIRFLKMLNQKRSIRQRVMIVLCYF